MENSFLNKKKVNFKRKLIKVTHKAELLSKCDQTSFKIDSIPNSHDFSQNYGNQHLSNFFITKFSNTFYL